MAGGPPKVNKSEEFELEIPDLGRVEQVKHYKAEISKAILDLRQTVLIKGQMARDLMLLHAKIEKPAEVLALFEWGVHARGVKTGTTVKCRFEKKHDVVVFAAILLVYYLHEFEAELVGESKVKSQLARLRALSKHGLKNFKVKGSDREGYYLRLQKGSGL